jgi:hypothetical protein
LSDWEVVMLVELFLRMHQHTARLCPQEGMRLLYGE